jgi:GT2 family glycosyltransferase
MKLISIDVERSWPSILGSDRSDAGELWALIRLHGQPLGVLHLDPSHPYSSTELGRLILDRFAWPLIEHLVADGLAMGDLSTVTEALTSLPVHCPQTEGEWPIVTVAVCTRDRSEQLAECLTGLARLQYPADRLDLLVVDNAPADDTTKNLLVAHPRVRYIVEPRPGLDWARNRAVLEARGAIVAFTDDDVIVDSGWVQAIAAVFENEPTAMCVTGLVVPDELDTDAQVLFEKYGGFGRGFARVFATADGPSQAASQHGGTGKFGTGANMAFRRLVFDNIGLFDPALDVGTVTNGGGDLEMFFRVIKAGHLLVYEPRAIVRHRHRREYAQLRAQLASHGIGFYSYLVRSALSYPEERGSFIRLGLWWFWHWNIRRLVASMWRRNCLPIDLILAELWGSLVGIRRYGVARDRVAAIEREYGPQRRLVGANR